MSLPPRQAVSVAHRARVLRALGVTPWVWRGLARDAAADDAKRPDAAMGAVTAPHLCVVVLPEVCSTRELDLLGRALHTGGAALARAARVSVSGAQLVDVPAASAYLVFGEAQAQALGRCLPVEVLQHAQIVLVDDLSQVLLNAGAKRRLWGALRGLRRSLAAMSG